MASDLPYPQDAGRTHWDGCWRDRGHHNCAVFEVERLLAEMDRLRDLVDRLKLEAQIHAGEARCQKTTVHECYQAASGATGERGTWHGANPVRERIEALEAERDRMRDALERWKELLTSDHVRIQTNDIGHDLAVSQLMEDTDRALNPNEEEAS